MLRSRTTVQYCNVANRADPPHMHETWPAQGKRDESCVRCGLPERAPTAKTLTMPSRKIKQPHVLLVLVPLAGFTSISFTKYPLKFFGLPLSKPGYPDEALNALFSATHKWLGWTRRRSSCSMCWRPSCTNDATTARWSACCLRIGPAPDPSRPAVGARNLRSGRLFFHTASDARPGHRRASRSSRYPFKPAC